MEKRRSIIEFAINRGIKYNEAMEIEINSDQ